MKLIKKCMCMITLVLTLLAMSVIPVLADDASYTYTITVSAGTKGTISGSSTITITGTYGDPINVNSYISDIAAQDGYYCKGFHEAGNEDLVGATTITRDTTYIAYYGKEGNRPQVTYTVNYVDRETGAVLTDPTTGNGFSGDQAIVSFQVIDGYMPEAYNEVQTLKEGEENSFTFYYVNIAGSSTIQTVVINGETRYTTNNNNNASAGNSNAAAANEANAGDNGAANGAGDNEASNNAGDNGAANGAGETEADNSQSVELPQETLDLDDQAVPQANITESGNDSSNEEGSSFLIGTVAKAVIIGICAVVIIAGIVFAIKKKKDKK